MALQLPQGTGTKVFSGVRAIFIFNGTAVAFASGVDASEEIQYQPVERLNDILVTEHVPVGYRTTLSCEMFRTVAKGASTDDTPGSIHEQNIMPQIEDILTVEGVDVMIQDVQSKKTLATFTKVKTASSRFRIGARQITQYNVSFVCVKMTDESK